MNKQYIILIVATIVIIIVAIILVIVVVHHTPNQNNNPIPLIPIEYPFKDGDQIRLSFVIFNNISSPNYAYSFYNIYPAVNGANNCSPPYKAMNVYDVFAADSILSVTFNTTDKTKFALKTPNDGYIFLGTVNGNKIMTFGGRDNPDNDDSWFSLAYLTRGENNYLITANDGSTMGIITVNPNCYSGPIINTGKGDVGYIIGSVDRYSAQVFSVSNLTTPITPPVPVPGYNFGDADSVLVTFQNSSGNLFYLFNGCSVFDTTITFTQTATTDSRVRWAVTISPDKRAFALAQNGQYLQTITDFSTSNYKVSVVGLSMGGSTVSNYTQGDYTNWFQLTNNRLNSLLTNMSFEVNQSDRIPCSVGSASFPIHGVGLNNSNTRISISKV